MQVPKPDAELLSRAFSDLTHDRGINGLDYNSSIVSGPGVTDTFDPDLLYDPLLAASYWPGGIAADETGDHHYVMHDVNGHDELNMNDERVFVRRLLLEGTIEAPAMERHSNGISNTEKEIARRAGILVVPTMIDLCSGLQAPLSYLVLGTVVRSRLIPAGERVAGLYYPMGMPPKAALGQIRRVVKDTIAQETL